MSFTATVWPIVTAVGKAALFIGADAGTWQTTNGQQELFLDHYVSYRNQIKEFSDTELRAWASTNHEELNSLLAKEGFSIRLNPFRPGDFGVVSILDVLVKWQHEGEKIQIKRNDMWYQGVALDKGIAIFDSGKHTVVKIATQGHDTVWMTVADKPLEGFALIEHVKSIRAGCVWPYFNPSSVSFPMVDLDQVVDIDWLLSMKLGAKYVIGQAKQQTKLRLNEKGAHVKSGVAIGVECTSVNICGSRHVVICEPFYLWIERPGLAHPIFAGYITEDDWKEPKK